MIAGFLGALVFITAGSPQTRAAESNEHGGTTNSSPRLELPADFVAHIHRRQLLDDLAAETYAIEELSKPVRQPLVPRPGVPGQAPRLVPTVMSPAAREAEALWTSDPTLVPRGFVAPILGHASHPSMTNQLPEAPMFVERSLGTHGLLATLTGVIALLGPQDFVTAGTNDLHRLWAVGLPMDLLTHFHLTEELTELTRVTVVASIATELLAGRTVEQVSQRLAKSRFDFRVTEPRLHIAAESGVHDIGTARLQISSGYQNGLIPGEALDVAGQLAAALPNADLLITALEANAPMLGWMMTHVWPASPARQITLITTLIQPKAWAQDNGKAGWTEDPATGRRQLATLTPRYVSRGETESRFLPGESFAMDRLRAASHRVVHSPLLFQGGDLLIVSRAVDQRRTLLMSETTLYRNVGLGLSREQALAAFRAEFAVEECAVLPSVSYHLDFDVSVRSHGGELVTFVNDPAAAALLIAEHGVATLIDHRMMRAEDTLRLQLALHAEDPRPAIHALWERLDRLRYGGKGYPSAVAKTFVGQDDDSAVDNLKLFLTSLDILAVDAAMRLAGEPVSEPPPSPYHEALRGHLARLGQQTAELRKLGWHIVKIPSMPDLFRSVNYLNGVHERGRYLMPAMGGYFTFLDAAAAKAFGRALGGEVQIVPIVTSGLQHAHGAVHCAVSAYPLLNHPPAAATATTPGL